MVTQSSAAKTNIENRNQAVKTVPKMGRNLSEQQLKQGTNKTSSFVEPRKGRLDSPMKDASFGSSNQQMHLQGMSSIQRSKRDMHQRKSSNDSTVFRQKAQEMVHSFHEDNELSKSIMSNKRESVFSGPSETVDWKEAINHKDSQQANHGKFRT